MCHVREMIERIEVNKKVLYCFVIINNELLINKDSRIRAHSHYNEKRGPNNHHYYTHGVTEHCVINNGYTYNIMLLDLYKKAYFSSPRPGMLIWWTML